MVGASRCVTLVVVQYWLDWLSSFLRALSQCKAVVPRVHLTRRVNSYATSSSIESSVPFILYVNIHVCLP
jgi:hypothetical protein